MPAMDTASCRARSVARAGDAPSMQAADNARRGGSRNGDCAACEMIPRTGRTVAPARTKQHAGMTNDMKGGPPPSDPHALAQQLAVRPRHRPVAVHRAHPDQPFVHAAAVHIHDMQCVCNGGPVHAEERLLGQQGRPHAQRAGVQHHRPVLKLDLAVVSRRAHAHDRLGLHASHHTAHAQIDDRRRPFIVRRPAVVPAVCVLGLADQCRNR
ncbi:hypothetical protein G6F22_017743 [Rhizopus arrhizus]|nr:hypothetical protein G6F22_017743 [Rhizopus arrhizus]